MRCDVRKTALLMEPPKSYFLFLQSNRRRAHPSWAVKDRRNIFGCLFIKESWSFFSLQKPYTTQPVAIIRGNEMFLILS